MDMDDRLHALEYRYRAALSASVAAKAHYLALLDEPSATLEARQRARRRWENLDLRKYGIAVQMGETPELD